jgi:hypothetical protein
MTANPVAFLQLSQQVTETLKEVRSEIGELKCEMKCVRDNARKPIISSANALIKLQTKEIQSSYLQIIDTKKREYLLESLIQRAIHFIRQQNQELINVFREAPFNYASRVSHTASLIEIAVATIDTQRLISENYASESSHTASLIKIAIATIDTQRLIVKNIG